MSKTAKATPGTAKPPEEIPFEEALKRLETIVDGMESGDLPLEKLLQMYEEGSALVRQCQSRLSEADLKVRQIEKKESGAIEARELELDEETSGT